MTSSALTFVGNAAWQVALLSGSAALAGRLLRDRRAALRHLAQVAALVASALLPAASLLGARVGAVASAGAVSAFGAGFGGPAAGAVRASGAVALGPRATALLLVLCGVLVAHRAVRLLLAALRTRRIARRSLVPLDGEALRVATRAARGLHVSRFQVCASPSVPGPITFGAFRPTVVVPAALVGEPELLAAALGHELAHVRRRDFLWNLVLELLVLPVAFHPGALYLKRRVDETRELACDELVAASLLEPKLYARCLIRLAGAALDLPRGWALGAVTPPLLDERVRRLVTRPRARRHLPSLLAPAALALGVTVAARFPLAIAATPSPPHAKATPAPDWRQRGLAACEAGDLVGADAAYAHLASPDDRREVVEACVRVGIHHCDAGFDYDQN